MQHLHQPLNQSWWLQSPESQRCSTETLMRWHETNFKLINLLHVENVNRTDEDLNTTIDKSEYWRNVHPVLYVILTSRAKRLCNGQYCYCAWSFTILDESHLYKTKNSVGREIAMTYELDSNIKSQLHQVSIHSMTTVIRKSRFFQMRLKIQRILL